MEGPPPKGRGPSRQPGKIEVPIPTQRAELIHPTLQGGIVLLEQAARKGSPSHGVSSGRPLPGSHHLLTETVAEVPRGNVGGVLPPRAAGGAQEPPQLLRAHAQQRTQEAPAVREGLHRARRRKARRAATPGEAHQHPLGDILLLVSQPDDAGVAREESQPVRAELGLARPNGRGGSPAAPEADAERPTPPAASVGVRPGGRPAEAVVEVQRQQAPPRPVRVEREQQGQGVGPAGKAHAPDLRPRPPARPREHRRLQPFPRQQRAEARRGLTQS